MFLISVDLSCGARLPGIHMVIIYSRTTAADLFILLFNSCLVAEGTSFHVGRQPWYLAFFAELADVNFFTQVTVAANLRPPAFEMDL